MVAFASTAHAQDDGSVDFELFHPAADNSGYFTVPGDRTLGHLELGTALWVHHANDPLVVTNGGQRLSIAQGASGDRGDGLVDSRLRSELHVGMGVTGHFSMNAALPIVLAQQGYHPNDLSTAAPSELASSGLGDIRLEPVYAPIRTVDSPVGVAIRLPVTVPSGRQDALMGAEGVTTTPGAVVELADGNVAQREHMLRAAVQAAYAIRPNDRLHDLQLGNAFLYGVAAAIHPTEVVEFIAEIHGEIGGPQGSQAPGEALVGLHFFGSDMVNVRLGGGTGLFGGVGAPDWRVVAGLSITPSFDPSARDADRDGISDDIDRCREVPEDIDQFQDNDGCPDKDNDADGILDTFDECPDDGEDNDGFQDKDGCPDKDNDDDGVPDISDRCPLAPETMNGHRDEDGCPDEPDYGDRDRDGILDSVDRCPDRAEVFNGVEDNDGCPDQGRVSVTAGAIKISERIYFDTGLATIQARSNSLLEEIASVLKSNPSITKVRVEGHTDNVGNEGTNLRLSQARADSVRKHLIGAGVASERLESRGFGETYPVVDNSTAEGRAANRRVEFIIVDRD